MLVLDTTTARILIDPEHGGRVAGATVLGHDVIVPRTPDSEPMTWGSYPMVPYAGRVRHGEFEFAGTTHSVPVTLGAHAIHGTVYAAPWIVTSAAATACELRCELGPDWPFGGSVTHRYTLTPDSLTCELTVSTDDRAMPAQVGWHPWFTKPESLEFHPGAMYRRDHEGLPDGTLVEVAAGPWDDCFADVVQPVVLRWPGLELSVSSDCDCWVVYDEPGHATCVEPQSGPPDGFTVAPVTVAPGGSLTRWMRWSWQALGG